MYKNIYVLYGYPLKTSLSPIIHNSTLDKSIYFKQPVKSGDLEFAINAIRKFNWKGANITIPHKVKVVKYLDEIDESVKTTGAVNTIENVGEKLIGYNTDVNGFKDSLPLFNKKERAIIIGAGGAARAVVFALIKIGFKEIHIYNRTLNRSQDLKEFFLKLFPVINIKVFSFDKIHLMHSGNILINCTPLDNPLTEESSHKVKNFECVYDLKYQKEIGLLKVAKIYNVKHVINGLDMLILQAAYAQKIWTNKFPDIQIIKEALK